MLYKSDHYGIEINLILLLIRFSTEYKSDHYGIEIDSVLVLVISARKYKSDHYGIEIQLTYQDRNLLFPV